MNCLWVIEQIALYLSTELYILWFCGCCDQVGLRTSASLKTDVRSSRANSGPALTSWWTGWNLMNEAHITRSLNNKHRFLSSSYFHSFFHFQPAQTALFFFVASALLEQWQNHSLDCFYSACGYQNKITATVNPLFHLFCVFFSQGFLSLSGVP